MNTVNKLVKASIVLAALSSSACSAQVSERKVVQMTKETRTEIVRKKCPTEDQE